MAKPDWGYLQSRFLSEHAKTGISPKDWCEAQGLNYSSARRYIKKPAAQNSAQKNSAAVRKIETAQRPDINDSLDSAEEFDVHSYGQKEQNQPRILGFFYAPSTRN